MCVFEPWSEGGPETLAERLDQVVSLSDKRLLGDAVAAADACEVGMDEVGSAGSAGALEIGVTGFCMGGMYALKAAGTGRFARAVSFYGIIRVPERWHGPDQGEPLDALASPDRCPTMAVVGTADMWTPPADVDAMESAGVTVVRYEGADHGFVHDPDRPTHRPDDAADAWSRALRFLGG